MVFRILHVDSDLDLSFLFSETLRKVPNIKIRWVSTKELVVEELRQVASSYDLIVCGICIPGWPNMHKHILGAASGVPVIIYTVKRLVKRWELIDLGVLKIFSKRSGDRNKMVDFVIKLSDAKRLSHEK